MVRILSDIPASSIRLVGDGNDDLYIIADGFGSVRLVDHLLGTKVESLKLGAANATPLTRGLTFTGSFNNNSLYGTALTTPGTLAVGQLRIGTQAVDANDFIIYNNVTGALLYDANGNGAGAAIQIATIGSGLAMTNADFVVI